MKQTITALFVLLAFGLTAGAQTKHGKRHHHRHKGDFAKMINLSDDQKAAAKKNNADMKAQLMALEKNDGITVKEYREKKSAIRKAHHEKMQGLLTDGQKTQLAGMKQQHMEKRKQHQEQRMAKLKSRINLTDQQVATLKAGHESRMQEMKKLKEDTQLGSTEKKEKMMALKKQQKEAFMALLTPEQKTKLEEMKKTHSKKFVK